MPLTSAADYQAQTKYTKTGMSGGGMDWSNQPDLYKTYPSAPLTALPRELVLPKTPGWRALQRGQEWPLRSLSLTSMANLLFMAYGFTSSVDYGTETYLYRSTPSAGALYPVEVYLAARGVEGLEDGLYHYSLTDFALTRLRDGAPPPGIPAPALILSGLFFRSAWKYSQRAFRYCLLDGGHVAENLMLIGRVLGLEVGFTAGFDDELVNEYLGLDPAREAALSVLPLGPISAGAEGGAGGTEASPPPATPVARREEVFDLIRDVASLTAAPLIREPSETLPWPPAQEEKALPPANWNDFEGPTLVEILRKRRSRRNFKPATVPLKDLIRILDLIAWPDADRVVQLNLVTNEVEDLADGLYHYQMQGRTVRRHKGGFLGPNLGDAALSQDWLGRANVILVLTSPLTALEEAVGPRALRLAYLAAGRLGQRAYLAAETLGWGCCGVGAFFDDELHRLLDLPEGEAPLYLIGLGPVKQRTHGGRGSRR